jgi:hypothetical protein
VSKSRLHVRIFNGFAKRPNESDVSCFSHCFWLLEKELGRGLALFKLLLAFVAKPFKKRDGQGSAVAQAVTQPAFSAVLNFR